MLNHCSQTVVGIVAQYDLLFLLTLFWERLIPWLVVKHHFSVDLDKPFHTIPLDSSHCLHTTAHRLKSSFSHLDRKSTRLNSSHVSISYAVFCLKKKN